MQNYVQKGQTLTVVAPYALLSGGGCQVGNIFGVTVNSQNIGDSSELVVEGVFDLAKDASTFNPGDKVFWNNTALQATSSPLTAAGVSNKEIGYAVLSQASGVNAPGGLTGDATVRVRLNPLGFGPVQAADTDPSLIQKTVVTLTAAQIMAMFGAAVSILPAPAAGQVLVVDQFIVQMKPGATAVHRRRRGVVPVSRDRRGAALVHHPRRDRHQRGRERERRAAAHGRHPTAIGNRHRHLQRHGCLRHRQRHDGCDGVSTRSSRSTKRGCRAAASLYMPDWPTIDAAANAIMQQTFGERVVYQPVQAGVAVGDPVTVTAIRHARVRKSPAHWQTSRRFPSIPPTLRTSLSAVIG